jgi:EAL domain-containing protein (putative c-di-GMP-specific phosphodiesterase class I)
MNEGLDVSPHLTSLLSRLGVAASAAPPHSDAICVVASITNLAQVERAYGSALASLMRCIVHEQARHVCETHGGIMTMSGEHILFVFDTPATLSGTETYAPRATVLIEYILSALADGPIEAAEGTVFAAVSATLAPWTDEPFDITAVGASAIPAGCSGREWRERYIADMRIAEKIFRAMDQDRLFFEWEPVQNAKGEASTRYFEALLCMVEGGGVVRAGSMVPALERLGLVRRLDQWVVESAIDTLRVNRALCLGCNVSGQSTTLDAWWASIAATLGEEPDIASRLIIEITETAPLNAPEEALAFVKSLQSFGCRVALDDVGTGHSSINALVHLGVDIAKIASVYLRQAEQDAHGVERFQQLVEFAKACAPGVVIEGVESDAGAAIARACGADWLQGYLLSRAFVADVKRPDRSKRTPN